MGAVEENLSKVFEWVVKWIDENSGVDAKNTWNENEVKAGVAENEGTEPQGPVEKAHVRCTCCKERISENFVYKREPKYVEYTNKTYPLNHKDTIFKDTFKGCTNTEDAICEIEILDDVWFEPDESTKIGDGYGIDEENSYMICTTGCGMIYVSDSGQVKKDIEDYLVDELLDLFINEETFRALGWDLEKKKKDETEDETEDETDQLKIVVNYGSGVFDELKSFMKSSGIVNAVSIKMFLATIQIESGGAMYESDGGKPDYFGTDVDYDRNVSGAGLMQISVGSQKEFLEYKYGELPEGDPMRERIKTYIDGYSADGKDNKYNATKFIADNYPVESATWYWGIQNKMVYTEGSRAGSGESLNDLVTRHANDNQYNTFAATQMAINGTNYLSHALDRFCECENNCEIKPTPENGCGAGHSNRTGYCFFLTEDEGNNDGDIYRHDYGPGNWKDRENIYSDICKFFDNGMQVVE